MASVPRETIRGPRAMFHDPRSIDQAYREPGIDSQGQCSTIQAPRTVDRVPRETMGGVRVPMGFNYRERVINSLPLKWPPLRGVRGLCPISHSM